MKFFDDLPDIVLKPHSQAKRLKLLVSPQGIRLTHPPKVNSNLIHQFVNRSYPWLKETWLKQQSLNVPIESQSPLPNNIELCYLDVQYQVIYQSQIKKYQLDSETKILYISDQSPEHFLTLFIINQAKILLPTQISLFAQKNNCTLNKVRVATPTTRWGSCSSKQEIMLHAGLLLMPKQYADYIVLHELAHTIHMHHQAEFWSTLENFMPNAKCIQSHVKKFRLPHWWQPKLHKN